jgi:hypothetical protein
VWAGFQRTGTSSRSRWTGPKAIETPIGSA